MKITQPSLRLDSELRTVRQTLSEDLHQNFNFSLKRVRLHFYTHSNKPGACLVKQLKHRLVHAKIPYLTSPSQVGVTNPKDIANRFSSFYAKLYNLTLSGGASSSTSENILWIVYIYHHCPQHNCKPSQIPSSSDVEQAITPIPLHKAPGPDGFSNEYYKHFSNLLASHLCKSFDHIASTGSIPPESLEATITTIPKPGKPLDDSASYRTI